MASFGKNDFGRGHQASSSQRHQRQTPAVPVPHRWVRRPAVLLARLSSLISVDFVLSGRDCHTLASGPHACRPVRGPCWCRPGSVKAPSGRSLGPLVRRSAGAGARDSCEGAASGKQTNKEVRILCEREELFPDGGRADADGDRVWRCQTPSAFRLWRRTID